MKSNQFILFLGLAFVGLFSRIIPHIPNVTSVMAIALFAGAVLTSRYLAFLLPVVMMYASDFILNNTVNRAFFPDQEGLILWADYMGWVYAGIIIAVLIGSYALKNRNTGKLILCSLTASTVFFALSNFGIWLQPGFYPENMGGLMSCYGAALPFFRNSLIADLVFTLVIFGIFDYVNQRYFVKQFA